MPTVAVQGALDTIVVNATFLADAGPAVGPAIGIRDGRIVAVGAADRVREVADDRTRVVDVGGRTVLPAFVDSHTHFHRGALLRELYLDFETLAPASLAEVLAAVRARAATLPPGAWVQGDGLSPLRLREGRLPDRHELDAAAGERPVVLRGIGKHVVAASTAALATAGIGRDTADPAGGRIERSADGTPTGVLHERAKLRLDTSHPETVVPAPTREERLRALRAGFRELHRKGVTTIHEMVRLPEEADDLSLLHQAGELGVRVRLYYRVHESRLSLDELIRFGIRRGLGDGWLRVAGVKVSVDGFCIFRNAALYEPYGDDPQDRGLMRIEPDELARLVASANAQGLNVAIHAVGVRAVDVALDAFEAAGPAVAGPHRIEHAYVDVDEARLARIRALGLLWSTQPGFLDAFRREWAAIFGHDRTARFMPLGLASRLGIPLAINSDFPCSPIDPLAAIRQAAGATADGGRGPDGILAPLDAVRAATATAHAAAGDTDLGTLAPGSRADLVVLDRPIRSTDDFRGARISATMIDGRVVFEEPGGEG